jgi:hypothetical protein
MFFAKVFATIQSVGYVYFSLIILADILLWKIHPVLGILGVLFTFSFLLGWF